MAMALAPPQVLTDSLCSLQLLRGWRNKTVSRVLQCDLRMLVRQVLAAAQQCSSPPKLEKVAAHDEKLIRLGHPKAMGNDQADFWAKKAALEPGCEAWLPAPGLHGDAVELVDSAGKVVWSVSESFPLAWWQKVRWSWVLKPRPRLGILYPVDVAFDWAASNGVLCRPVSSGGSFVHLVAPAVVKWLGRVRCGCLATRACLHRHRMGVSSPACLCCGAAIEDEEHVLAGCPATGSADWASSVLQAWADASSQLRIAVAPPPEEWVRAHRLPLVAALIPRTVLWHHPLPASEAQLFLAKLHICLATHLSDWMRRRGKLMAQPGVLPPSALTSSAVAERGESSSSSWGSGLRRPCHLPAERRLSVPELRQVERLRRETSPAASQM